MQYRIVEDSELAKKNLSLIIGGGGIAYNAVLETAFSDDGTETEPVTLQAVKDWCRIDVADDDALITELITAARLVCEHASNLSFIQRTVTATIHNGLGNFNLPYGPVIGEVTSIANVDGDAVTEYVLRDPYDSDMTVVYEAGYETLPRNLRSALLAQIAFMYENRGDAKVAAGVSELSKLILKQVRVSP